MLTGYESTLSVPARRLLTMHLNGVCEVEGGRLSDLGAEAYIQCEEGSGGNKCVEGGYGNLFKKVADD
jgi:hypothetical protein